MRQLFSTKLSRILLLVLFSLLFFSVFSVGNKVEATFDFTDVNGVFRSLPDLPSNITLDYGIIIKGGEYLFALKNSGNKFYLVNNNSVYFSGYRDGWHLENGYWVQTEFNKSSSGQGSFGAKNEIWFTSSGVYVNSTSSDFAIAPMAIPKFLAPAIINTPEDLATGSFGTLLINSHKVEDRSFLLNMERLVVEGTDGMPDYYVKTTMQLSKNSQYYHGTLMPDGSLFIFYEIPQASLSMNIINGQRYRFSITYTEEVGGTVKTTAPIYFTIGGLTDEDKMQNALDSVANSINNQTNAINEQTDAIKEQTDAIQEQTEETKKGFAGLLDGILNLPKMIIDGIVSIFIPEDGFFSAYFDELMQFFSDRFGFLAYPFELFFNIINKFLNVSSNSSFTYPDIIEPFTKKAIIPAGTINLSAPGTTFDTLHNTYYIIVDFIIGIALVRLAWAKWDEVMDK